MTVFHFARLHDINDNQMFKWRKQYEDGSLAAVTAGEDVVPTSELAAATSNVLRTPSNNKIRLDDNRGEEHIKVSMEYGDKSQLNLGHQMDSEQQKRGEGFELRTGSWEAIRAIRGYLSRRMVRRRRRVRCW